MWQLILEYKYTSVGIFADPDFMDSSKLANPYKDPSCHAVNAALKAVGQFSSNVIAKEAVAAHLVPKFFKNNGHKGGY